MPKINLSSYTISNSSSDKEKLESLPHIAFRSLRLHSYILGISLFIVLVALFLSDYIFTLSVFVAGALTYAWLVSLLLFGLIKLWWVGHFVLYKKHPNLHWYKYNDQVLKKAGMEVPSLPPILSYYLFAYIVTLAFSLTIVVNLAK